MSTGVHDPLYATGLFLDDGDQKALLVSVDVIWLSKRQIGDARRRIQEVTGVPPTSIMISATHTHSGPVTVQMISNANDPVVTAPDRCVIQQIEDGIVAAASTAMRVAEPAEFGFAEVDVSEIGGNRHDSAGPSLPRVAVFATRATNHPTKLLAIGYVFSVHPTVLHEDSTLVSSDFPGFSRRHLQTCFRSQHYELPVLHHIGAAGNQSPRNMVRANTVEEAERLGVRLGMAIEGAVAKMRFLSKWSLKIRTSAIALPLRELPTKEQAATALVTARLKLEQFRANGSSRGFLRTAECDLFGAEEVVSLVTAAENGELANVAATCLPAEIQTIRVGKMQLVGWPGEVFVEYALQIRNDFPHAVVITLAGGELQGYLTTQEAVVGGWYEASNAIFSSPTSAEMLVHATRQLLRD
jgi:hypothetical protein